MAFSVSVNPWVYYSKYMEDEWTGTWQMKPHQGAKTEEGLGPAELKSIVENRNSFPELPLINYTTQYGLGCFEGIKAYPQKDGSIKIFRPEKNAMRMQQSMEGLMMPGYPVEDFVAICREMCIRNQAEGFSPSYDPIWEKDNFLTASAIYLRPFSYSEAGIGVNISRNPWIVFAATTVGSYFNNMTTARGITVDSCRATPGGTGWMKCASNYVIPTLEREKASKNGYMEVIFLDAYTKTNVEEGSSCNLFALLKNGVLVTPELGDTILPGITRETVCVLAKEQGIQVEERALPVQEILSDAKEIFLTGTAAGVCHLSSITHKGKEHVFGDGSIGELTLSLQSQLKGIQYGLEKDPHGWMLPV